jgi:WD40 repeat protein
MVLGLAVTGQEDWHMSRFVSITLGLLVVGSLLGLETRVTALNVVKAPGPAENATQGTPRLVIEAGGHEATVRELLFTADGRELISVSDDKTIRIWSVSPDGRQASLARTLRGEIGDGRVGQLAAAALSPPDATGQQRWLAVGGFLAGAPADRHAVRLHEYASGEVRALLHGHTDLVLALAFSPAGRWLASAGKDNTIRLWDLASLQDKRLTKAPLVLNGHDGHIYDLAWSATGTRLAAASDDRTVSLWNTELVDQGTVTRLARLRKHKHQVRSVAFHPDGAVLASGGKDQTIRLWRAQDGKSLGVLARAPNQVAALAFAPDGQWLLAGRAGGADKPEQITLYAYPSGAEQQIFTGHDNIVLATAFHPSGRWVASAGGNQKAMVLWDVATGAVRSRLLGSGQTIWAVGFAKDGGAIGWGQTFAYTSDLDRGPLEYRFDLKRLKPDNGGFSPSTMLRAQDRIGSLELSTESGGAHGHPLRLHVRSQPFGKRLLTIERGPDDGYRHSAYTFTPDAQHILSGGLNGMLTLYTLGGEIRARLLGHTGEIKAVAVSADGRWAVSGASDQTLKLWSLAHLPEAGSTELQPTLTLFPTTQSEWVAWTPGGLFTASEHGAQLIGYSVNQGIDHLAKYVSVTQLYDRFYRPDAMLEHLQSSSGAPAIQSGKAELPQITQTLAKGLPPQVTFVSPIPDSEVTQRVIPVHVAITDQGGGIGTVEWKVNGVTVATENHGEADAARPEPTRQTLQASMTQNLTRQMTLSEGINTIAVTGYNRSNEIASVPALLVVTLKVLPMAEKPALHLLVVGVNRYLDKSLWLKYAVPDAQALATTLCTTASPLFGAVTIEHVYDEHATLSGIQAAFNKVAARADVRDVFVLYLAGHGVTRDARYYFLPYDFRYRSDTSIHREAINQEHLQRWLASVPARKSLVMIDTCESGSFPQFVYSLTTRGMAEKTAVAKLMRATGRGTIVAATDEQVALEGIGGHGAFTYVLMQALGQADTHSGNRDGVTSFFEVAQYVGDQVPKMTMREFGYEQIPQVSMVGSDFPIGVVGANARCEQP